MNKAMIAAVALLLTAGLGLWLLAGDDQWVQAPLVPDAAAPAATVAPGAPSGLPASSRTSGRPGTPQGTAGADDGSLVEDDGKPKSGQTKHEPLTKEEYELPEMFHIPRGLDRSEAKDGEALTDTAMKQADMGALDPSDGAYDEVVETHQLFNPLEKDFLARSKVTADDWADLLNTHSAAKEAMLDRTVELAQEGHAEESESMLLEWNALESQYALKVEN